MSGTLSTYFREKRRLANAGFAPRIVVDDEMAALGRDFTPNEINAILKFKEYLLQLQDLAHKTSEEKTRFSESDKKDSIAADHTLNEMSKKYTSVQGAINEAIGYRQLRTDDQFEQAQKLISNLEREIFIFKNSLEKSPAQRHLYQGRTPHKILAEKVTQTNEEDLSSKYKIVGAFSLEVLNKDNISQILAAVKDCMDIIVQESGSNWKITAREISEFLRGNHNDVKRQLEISVAEYLEKNNQLQISTCESVLVQTANIEKQLFDIFLFLDRQLVDAQAVAETLRFFNRKFMHFAQKCDKKWEDSCANYITTCNRVQEAQENMNFSSSKMSRITCSLRQHNEALENLLKESGAITQTVAGIIATGDFSTHGKDQIEAACYTIEELEGRVFKVEDVYRYNMRCILELIEKPGKKLESLLQYIEELGILSDFVKNITKTYESMISCSYAESGMNQLRLLGDSESVQELRDGTEKFSLGEASQTMLGNLNGFAEGASHLRIISMLNDVIKKTASKMSKSSDSMDHRKYSKENWIQTFSQAESKMKQLNIWDSSISETALSDINSDCLLPKSSGSSARED
ncbi:hypothetical protein HNY73_018176 [Argiope bruennichi]|uniref:Uncharacterized protein n=1 Tax=Argiope bruennichi TaxID=94029 RepID=A0A8T0ECC8_ARGBR|nr:hypothetical protein HNY73_018176 [Argiope bruennichi]